jgi:hypothetical protein
MEKPLNENQAFIVDLARSSWSQTWCDLLVHCHVSRLKVCDPQSLHTEYGHVCMMQSDRLHKRQISVNLCSLGL